MQFLKKYWWAILLVAVVIYLLWKSMKDSKSASSDTSKNGVTLNVGGVEYPAKPITDSQGNPVVATELDLSTLPHRG